VPVRWSVWLGGKPRKDRKADLPRFMTCLAPPVEQRKAFSTGNGLAGMGGDPFHLSTMSSFSVSWIAQDHAMLSECMDISSGSDTPMHGLRLELE